MEDGYLSQPLSTAGLLALSYLLLKQLWKLLRGLQIHVLSRWWRTDLRKYGGWAVITGVTDGIGKAYAEELARMGFDIVLISRNMEKLQKVAEGIVEQTGRKTKIIQADFTGGPEIYPKIEEGLKGLNIGILVNNVGMVYNSKYCKFLDVTGINKRIMDILNCNLLSMVQMTRIILPTMVERKKGLIINISSECGTRPYPMMTMYSATKVFMDFFSRCLHAEYQSQGITVQCVMPLMVSTNMTFNLPSNFYIKNVDSFVREALNTVGYTNRTSGCLNHSIQSYIIDLFFNDYVLRSRICSIVALHIFKFVFRSKKFD